MSVLVTGCAGFIGSRVVQQLLDSGETVVGIDNLCNAYDVRLKEHRLNLLLGQPGFSFERIDISDRAPVEKLLAHASYDAVINLAAQAGVRRSVDNPWVYVDTNVTGTLNLLHACARSDVGKFVQASTSSLYGASNTVPFREDANTDRPLSPYAASKKGSEALCASYHALYDIDVTILRYFTVYGPAGRPDMSVFRFIRWIAEGEPLVLYGDGNQERDFTYVEDIARGTVRALRPLGLGVINLGGDRPHSILELIEHLERLIGKKAVIDRQPPQAADVPRTWANVEKAKQLLGWTANVSFEEGLERTVRWYVENRDWAKDVVLS